MAITEQKKFVPPTALPASVLAFGKVPDFAAWHPGDVILTKNPNPDAISKAISAVQKPNYGQKSAEWTHAAIYLGDGLLLCEAQIDINLWRSIFKVQIANCWEYYTSHCIRVRRSRHAKQREEGWAIAIAAATKIGEQYDWQFILKIAADRVWLGEDVFVRSQQGKVSARTYVCSSLYSTAHVYATDVNITDKTNGLCVPAFLAITPHLFTVKWGWVKIADDDSDLDP
jgi:hypothetical protein